MSLFRYTEYHNICVKSILIAALFLSVFIIQSSVAPHIAKAGEPTYWSPLPRDGWITYVDSNPYTTSFATIGTRAPGDYAIWVSINGEIVAKKDYTVAVECTNLKHINCRKSVKYYYKFRRGENEVILYDSYFEGSVHGPSETRLVYFVPRDPDSYVEPEKNLGSTGGYSSFINSANSINPATGNKFIIETDFKGPGSFPLTFKRYYNSINEYAGGSKFWDYWNRWRTYYDRTLAKITDTVIHIKRPDGKLYIFTKNILDEWETDSDVTDKLEVDGTGYKYTTMDGVIEHYNSDGVLQSMDFRNLTLSMAYNTEGRLSTVSDQWGRTIQFAYDSSTGRLSTITDPLSRVYTYRYDTDGNLKEVEYPGGEIKTYLYEDTSNERLLTGVIDETNNRLFTWQYDSEGRIVHQDKAGDDAINLTYDSDTTTTVTNYAGKSTTYYYDVKQGVKKRTGTSVSCTGCITKTSSITYGSNGHISSITDYEGNQTTYTYNAEGLEISRTEAVGTPQERTITTQWNTSHMVPTQVVTPEKTIDYTYTTDGLMLTKTETDPDTNQTRTWTYTYNPQELLQSVDGPRTDVSDITTYTYDSTGNRLTEVNALSHTINYTSYDAFGRLLSVTNANGLVISYTYGDRDELLTQTIDGRTVTNTYDNGLRLTRRDFPDGTYRTFTYDTADRITQIDDSQGNSVVLVRDDGGYITEKKILDPSQNLVFKNTQSWDAEGNLQSEANAQGQATIYTYNKNGHRTSATDPLSNVRNYAYDALGRMNQFTDAESGVTAYVYNTADQLVSVTDPLSVTTNYTYDGFGNLLTESNPDTGQTTHTYDLAGNRITRTDANSVTTTYSYDALNRVTGLSFPDSTQNIVLTYDLGAAGLGSMTGMTDPSGSYQFTYDLRGNMTQDSRTILGVNYVTSYAYDADGKLASITYPSGRLVEYLRDTAGKVTTVRTGGTQIVVDNITHLPYGPVNSFGHGNGVAVTRTYNQDYLLTALTAGSLVNLSYTHDNAGIITGITDNLVPGNSQTFGYDGLYQLTSATGVYGSLAYTYDAAGNRLSKNHNGSVDTYALSTGSNKLTSITGANPETFGYDSAGSVTSRANTTFDYNQNKRMIRATVGGSWITDYVVNGLGQRVIKTQSTTVTVYHYNTYGQLIAETDDTGTLRKEYIYLDAELVGVVDNGNLYHAQVNQRLEPIIVSNASGVAVWKSSSLPFGQATVDEDPDGDSVLFSLNKRLLGQYYDSETSQHYNYFRDYLPIIGRYIQNDPIGLKGGINRYVYALNSPIVLFDPYGLKVSLVGRPLAGKGYGIGDHVGIKIESDDGSTTYYEYMPDGMHNDLGSKWNPDQWGYKEREMVSDSSMDKFFKQAYENLLKSGEWHGKNYNLAANNCWDFIFALIREAQRLWDEQNREDGGGGC